MLKNLSLFTFILASFSSLANTGEAYTLSLKDSIALALRNNPTIQIAELDRITQKYALVVQKNNFMPQYFLNASFDHTSSSSNGQKSSLNTYNIKPAIELTTHYGTKLALSSDNLTTIGDHYTPSLTLSVQQPLIRGFGRHIVNATLNDVFDDEEINKLSLKNTAISTINLVINNYFELVQAIETLKIDKLSLEAYEKTLKNDNEIIKAGRMAKSNIIQTEAQIATQKATIQNDINAIDQARLKLLDTLGLDPNADIKIPKKIDFEAIIKQISGDKKLNIKTYQKLALGNNISYQTETIQLKKIERALMVAKNNNLWALDLNAQKTINSDTKDGGFNSMFDGKNQNQTINLELTIPIHDLSLKQSLLNAKVGLDQANINHKEARRQLETDVINYINIITSNKTQLNLSKQALELQRKTLEISITKQQAGRISTFELNNKQEDLTQAEQRVVTTMISYINSLATFDQILGTTLEHWGIKIRY